MDDLRRRFATLANLEAPDMWPDVQERLAAADRALPTTRAVIGSPAVDAWRAPGWRLTLIAGVLIGLLVAGTVAVGSGLLMLPSTGEPSVEPSPVPTAPTETPAPATSPTTAANPSTALVAWTVVEPVDPAPEFCNPPNRPWCVEERIRVVNTDGTGARPLLPDVAGSQQFLAWHPDGTRLLYRAGRGELVLVDLDGSDPQVFPVSDTCPVENCPYMDGIEVSPDGARIVYVLGDSGTEDTTVLAVFDLESRDLALLESTRVTASTSCLTAPSDGTNDAPVWSPDGTTIAFVRQGIGPDGGDGGCQTRLLLVNADGTNLRELSLPGVRPLRPRWSADGSMVLFHDTVFANPGDAEGTSNIYVVRPDGTGLRLLTDDNNSVWPRWLRDGRILFVRWTSPGRDRYDLWRMNADGTDDVRIDPSIASLTAAGCIVCPAQDDPGSGTERFWQPVP
jgi:Tol biopolymer transport system component